MSCASIGKLNNAVMRVIFLTFLIFRILNQCLQCQMVHLSFLLVHLLRLLRVFPFRIQQRFFPFRRISRPLIQSRNQQEFHLETQQFNFPNHQLGFLQFSSLLIIQQYSQQVCQVLFPHSSRVKILQLIQQCN